MCKDNNLISSRVLPCPSMYTGTYYNSYYRRPLLDKPSQGISMYSFISRTEVLAVRQNAEGGKNIGSDP